VNPNIARWERIARWIFGTLMLAWAVAGGPSWAYFSLYFIITGVFGVCPVYFTFRTKKIRR
jgi:hypothetical protein